MSDRPVTVALAILYRDGKFLLQLRDNIPSIRYPGQWGLFGGHLEAGETPDEGLKRELLEELNYSVAIAQEFRCYADENAVRHVYYAPLTVPLTQLVLQEGWDMALVSSPAIESGQCYSPKAGHSRPLGTLHRQILLDFLEAKLL